MVDPYDPSEGTKPGCLPWVLAAKILMGVGGGLAGLVGYAFYHFKIKQHVSCADDFM